MPILRVRQENKKFTYFITLTIWNWYYIFDRHQRWKILADSIKFCQKNKGLVVHSYVFMLNHLHMIVRSEDIIGFLRDFKTYTSKRLKENIIATEPRILELFLQEGKYQFWKNDNKPKLIDGEKFFNQKRDYIHDNPVKKGYVERPEHWKWSSANIYSEIKISNS